MKAPISQESRLCGWAHPHGGGMTSGAPDSILWLLSGRKERKAHWSRAWPVDPTHKKRHPLLGRMGVLPLGPGPRGGTWGIFGLRYIVRRVS